MSDSGGEREANMCGAKGDVVPNSGYASAEGVQGWEMQG